MNESSLPTDDKLGEIASLNASESNEADPVIPSTSGPSGESVLLALRRNVTASSRDIGGKRILVLHNEESGKFYHLGAEESVVVSLLDGSIPLNQVAPSLKSLCIEWTDDELKAFLAMLVKSGLLSVVGADGHEQASAPPEPPPPRPAVQRVGMALGQLLSQRLPLGNADALASRLLPYVGFAYSRVGFAVWVIAITITCGIALDHSAAITAQCKLMFQPESWISIACVGVLIKVVHELGHAIAAKRKGVRVGSVGLTFFLFAPLAYIDLTNSWKLRPRWARIQIALGGVYLESWLAIFSTILFAWSSDEFTRHLLAQVMLIAGPATWVTNANPLLRLDGYYALSDGLDIPNLRMHGRNRCLAIFDHWLLGIPMQESHLNGWRRHFAVCHALGSIVFQAFWMTGLVVAVWHWASSLGAVLACVALISWIVIPTAAWWMRHWNAAGLNPVMGPGVRRRMLAVATVLMMAIPTVLSARNPFAQGVPVVVQYRNEQVARAAVDGFVSSVFVKGNEYVHRGDLLMEITDEDLLLRRDQMSDELEVSLAKYRQLQNNGKLADAEAAHETAKQLRVSISELNESLAALCIVAMRDGVVVSEQPEKWLGRYAKRGDVLIRIADPDDKELLVAIAESEYSAYHQAVKQGRPLTARIRGGSRLQVEPLMANPRFTTTLPHPALAAPAGGDIAVTPDAKEEHGYRAAVPIGAAIASLTPKESLLVRVGQRGTLYLADDQITFARLKQVLTEQP
jgi:putative peptide zinc metalloprotease protein